MSDPTAHENLIGIRADELLRQPERAMPFIIAPAQWLEPGQSCVWHYHDVSIVLKHDGQLFRVADVVEDIGQWANTAGS